MRKFCSTALLCLTFGAQAGVIIPNLPDPCTLQTHNGSIRTVLLAEGGNVPSIPYGALYVEASVERSLPGPAELVVITNGNSYSWGDYQALAHFLARNGFIVVVAERYNNTGTDPMIVYDAIFDAFGELPLTIENTSIVMLGHSRGGGVVHDAARLNTDAGSPFDVSAVITLAPHVGESVGLVGADTPSYLTIYGSRDQDMAGSTGYPRESFAAYDRSGTEGSTTCNSPPCILWQPLIDRTMVYIHGADHPGLIGLPTDLYPESEFVAPSDQACLTRGYVNGFLRWKLRGQTVYQDLLRGKVRPPTWNSITSSQADGLGNPAGSAVRIGFQSSPAQRKVIENFEDGSISLAYLSNGITGSITQQGQYPTAPRRIRHVTRALRLLWPNSNSYQYIGLNVPSAASIGSTYSHLSVRIGPLFGEPGRDNPINQDLEIWVGLGDASTTRWARLYDYGTILRTDLSNGGGRSAMNTIQVPLSAFNGLDQDDIQRVYFAFPPGHTGAVLIDSIEWVRD
ncbi:MAG: hypothetical protein DHS20C11_16490 [Lysobacteraceae bacterium]|nr:MAG: hypothetical protein DHS20C11_16490 [Xanthomonadaceae bacterium]